MNENGSTHVDQFPTLRALVDPHSWADFCQHYWTQRPLYVSRSTEGWYDHVMSVDDLDLLCRNENLPIELFRLFKDGSFASKFEIMNKSQRPKQVASMSRLLEYLERGYTVELDAVQRVMPKVTDFIDALVGETRMDPLCKVIVTPRDATGLKVHYDIPELFIMQIAGAKRWRLYATPRRFVASSQYGHMLEDCAFPGEPIAEHTLYPGDLLYVPGGMPHTASATGDASIHISLGLRPPRWLDLFDDMKHHAAEWECFREHLAAPLRSAQEQSAAIKRFKDELIEYVSRLDVEALMRVRMERVMRERPAALPGDRMKSLLFPAARVG